jgi:hypothetical protein
MHVILSQRDYGRARVLYDGAEGDGLHGHLDSSLGDQTDDRYLLAMYCQTSNRAIGCITAQNVTRAQ